MNILQVGTNSGNDHVLKFCKHLSKNNINKLLLVEPFSIHNPQIELNYKGFDYNLFNIAIVPNKNQEKITFYFHEKDVDGRRDGTPAYEVASINIDHIIKHYGNDRSLIRSFNVPCITLNEFIENNLKNMKLDYLYLDIEGIDMEVIMSLNLNKYDIENIIIEILHLDKEKLISYMSNYKYHPVDDSSFDNYIQKGYDLLFKKKL